MIRKLRLMFDAVHETLATVHFHSSEATAFLILGGLVAVAAFAGFGWWELLWFAIASGVALRNVAAGRPLLPQSDRIDMRSKWVIVTGANSGIGFEVTRGLFEMGANVIIACRNERKAVEAQQQLERKVHVTDRGSLFVLGAVDVSDTRSIVEFCNRVKAKTSVIDIVVSNAGVLSNAYQRTPQGAEWHVGVHAVGPLCLFRELSPLLKASPIARFINVSSSAHCRIIGQVPSPMTILKALHGPQASKTFQRMGAMKIYGFSKLCGIYVTNTISDRNRFVNATSVHPGMCTTHIFDGMLPPQLVRVGYFISLMFGRTWAEAAVPVLHAAVAKEFVRRGYVVDCREYGDRSPMIQLSEWARHPHEQIDFFNWATQLIESRSEFN